MRGVIDRRSFGANLTRGAHAGAEAVVDVLLDAEVGLHGVDEAGDAVVVRRRRAGRPCRRAAALNAELDVAASAAAVDGAAAELGERLRDAQLRLVGDVAHRARQRAGAEQRALRAAQHFDAVRVEQIEVRREQRQRDDRLVEVDADLLLHARLVAHDLAGGHAAHRDLALAGAEVLHGEARRRSPPRLRCPRRRASRSIFFGRRRDRERHVEQRLLALGGGDGDLFGQLRVEPETSTCFAAPGSTVTTWESRRKSLVPPLTTVYEPGATAIVKLPSLPVVAVVEPFVD